MKHAFVEKKRQQYGVPDLCEALLIDSLRGPVTVQGDEIAWYDVHRS